MRNVGKHSEKGQSKKQSEKQSESGKMQSECGSESGLDSPPLSPSPSLCPFSLCLVGGFLGAGKTTFLEVAAGILAGDGHKVGLITNDQAAELVDTALLSHVEVPMAELSGSCFCCNFHGFEEALMRVKGNEQVDIILAEPVGSCTDLVSTIIQPLNRKDIFTLAPLVVLADPDRLTDIVEGGDASLHPSAAYIYRKQLEESDIILITKTDVLHENELQVLKEKVQLLFPDVRIMAASAKTGAGMADILKVLLEESNAGTRRIEVDYDRYAEGEAVLGWLNGTLLLESEEVNWEIYVRNFLEILSKKIDDKEASVGHVKVILEYGRNYILGNLTGKGHTLNIRSSADKSNAALRNTKDDRSTAADSNTTADRHTSAGRDTRENRNTIADRGVMAVGGTGSVRGTTVNTGSAAKLIINARVGMPPDELDEMVRASIDAVSEELNSLEVKAWQCFSPNYPSPTFKG